MVGIWLVEKLSSEQVPFRNTCHLARLWKLFLNLIVPSFEEKILKLPQASCNILFFQLLERLTSKGKRQPEFTRELIKNKLTDDEDGIATTNLKVQISMPQILDETLCSICHDIQSAGDCELPTGKDEDVHALQAHNL